MICCMAAWTKLAGFNFGFVVGGDFNTQFHAGFRGSLLNDLVDAFELQIANDDNNHDVQMDTWTFESPTGVRGRTVFLLFSVCLPLLSGCATDCIDMGSDHRAVTVCFHFLPAQKRGTKQRFKMNKGWNPKKSANGFAETYKHWRCASIAP